MNSAIVASILLSSLVTAGLLARRLRRHLPEDHLVADSKDAVKLAMGLVATMTALLLGLLVSSAKSNYDTQRTQVIVLASKVAFLGRVLHTYGPDAAEAQAGFREAVAGGVHLMWPDEAGKRSQLAPNVQVGDRFYATLQALTPRDDRQRALKEQAVTLAADMAQLRVLMQAQLVPSIPRPLLIMVGCWLAVIFHGFSLLAPPNGTTGLALIAAAISVAGAVFLMLELDQPFDGLIRISSAPLANVLNQLPQ